MVTSISGSSYELVQDKDDSSLFNIMINDKVDYSFKPATSPKAVEVFDRHYNKVAFAVVWRHKLCGKQIRYYTKGGKVAGARAPVTLFDQFDMNGTQKKDFLFQIENV